MQTMPLGIARVIPVAAPTHALARLAGPISTAIVRGHVQLVLTDRSELTSGRDFEVFATHTWRLGDLGAKHALLLAGLGWGGMPESIIASDLDAGRLVRLPLESWNNTMYRLNWIYRADTPPGPAGRWLMNRLLAAFSTNAAPT